MSAKTSEAQETSAQARPSLKRTSSDAVVEERPNVKRLRPASGRTEMTDAAEDANHTTTSSLTPNTPEVASNSRSKGRACFLGLSAELRNQIYEEVLLIDGQEDYVVLDEHFRPPALLQVCRLIRSETHRMYWAQESDETITFCVNLHDCDSSMLLRVQRLQDLVDGVHSAMGGGDKSHIFRYEACLRGRCDWANLVQWCWKVYRAEIRYEDSIVLGSAFGGFEDAAVAALAIAKSHIGGSWSACEKALTKLRWALSWIDDEWLEGEDGFAMCK